MGVTWDLKTVRGVNGEEGCFGLEAEGGMSQVQPHPVPSPCHHPLSSQDRNHCEGKAGVTGHPEVKFLECWVFLP